MIKSRQAGMKYLLKHPENIEKIRDNPILRYEFNKNRIRLLAPGQIFWTVPNDWPIDFVHIQIVGSGYLDKAGEYVQGVIPVEKGQTLTGIIVAANENEQRSNNTNFAGLEAKSGGGNVQEGAFLMKATSGTATNYDAGQGGFEGGKGGDGLSGSTVKAQGGTGDGTLGHCENTGAQDGSGGGGSRQSQYFAGGGGYGGGGGGGGSCNTRATAGSGAVIITCPEGYIPEYTVYNTIDGVTAWRRDDNIFNAF